jgi:hypothetical protein
MLSKQRRKVHLGDRNAQIKDILVAQKDGENVTKYDLDFVIQRFLGCGL